jgi:dTDP-4-dehydrorhamnose 3,5-epimerase-like enzyme
MEIRMTTLEDVKLTNFSVIKDIKGDIFVYQGLTFTRFFIVNSSIKQIRGAHAHKECTQLLCAIEGSIRINLYDGYSTRTLLLKKNTDLVLIPPGIWADQEYERNSKLLVMCDLEFDELDYIRNWNDYLKFKSRDLEI